MLSPLLKGANSQGLIGEVFPASGSNFGTSCWDPMKKTGQINCIVEFISLFLSVSLFLYVSMMFYQEHLWKNLMS